MLSVDKMKNLLRWIHILEFDNQDFSIETQMPSKSIEQVGGKTTVSKKSPKMPASTSKKKVRKEPKLSEDGEPIEGPENVDKKKRKRNES